MWTHCILSCKTDWGVAQASTNDGCDPRLCGPVLQVILINGVRQQLVACTFDMSETHSLIDEKCLGSWPRRLLHVESMQSFPWQPGNIYHGVKEPAYNAFSYTWGRWALKAHLHDNPHVQGLPVSGVEWALPLVDPDHFSCDDFLGAIKQAAYISRTKDQSEGEQPTEFVWVDHHTVDFVWVDVACIDQRFNTESMLEIGRQAAIFGGAASVYIWLCRKSSDALAEMAQQAQSIAYDATQESLPVLLTPDTLPAFRTDLGTTTLFSLEKDWFQETLQILRGMCQDPWFTSLWTLQEAFLRSDAVFMGRDGNYVTTFNDEDDETDPGQPFTLHVLLDMCESLRLCIERNVKSGNILSSDEICRDILTLLDISGFNALYRGNPMELYRAAAFRKPTNTLDCIYGIMQVFNVRLGRSNPEADPEAVFSLTDLEDELGVALMKICPVFSQCFQRTSLVSREGENWRVCAESTVPNRGITNNMPWEPELYRDLCQLGSKVINGTVWGYFKGKMCHFAVLERAWSYDTRPTPTEQARSAEPGFRTRDSGFLPVLVNAWSVMTISLDFAEDIFTEWRTVGDYNVSSGSEQHTIARRLVESFHNEDVRVLHLGSWGDENLGPDSEVNHFGLLLLRNSPGTSGPASNQSNEARPWWRRLGICRWQSYPFQQAVWRTRQQLFDEGYMSIGVQLGSGEWLYCPTDCDPHVWVREVRALHPDDDFNKLLDLDAELSISDPRLPTEAEASDMAAESGAWSVQEGFFG